MGFVPFYYYFVQPVMLFLYLEIKTSGNPHRHRHTNERTRIPLFSSSSSSIIPDLFLFANKRIFKEIFPLNTNKKNVSKYLKTKSNQTTGMKFTINKKFNKIENLFFSKSSIQSVNIKI